MRNPAYLEGLPEGRQMEIAGNLTYVRQYCEMPLKILKAERLVGGGEAMAARGNKFFFGLVLVLLFYG